jgi:hypothetical protein
MESTAAILMVVAEALPSNNVSYGNFVDDGQLAS